MRYLLLTLLFSGLLAAPHNLRGQQSFRLGPGVVIGDTTQLQELVLVDYSTVLGLCLNISSDQVFFKLRNADAVTEFPKSEVRYLGLFVPLTSGKSEISGQAGSTGLRPAFSDATYERTALPTRGKGQVRVVNVLYAVAEFKLNDNFQLGVGLLTPVGLLTTQRLRFPIAEKLHFGLSNQAVYSTLGFDGGTLIGDLTANFTVGDENRFFNLGGGIFYNTSDDLQPTHLNLAVGGRIGENWHLYGEMAVVDDRFEVLVFPSISAAHTIRRHRWRFGIVSILTEFDAPLIPIPLVGYEYHW